MEGSVKIEFSSFDDCETNLENELEILVCRCYDKYYVRVLPLKRVCASRVYINCNSNKLSRNR